MNYDAHRALIFDCDGTLVDSMPAHFIAWTKALKPHGLAFPEDRFYATGGMPSDRIIAMLAEEQGIDVDIQALADAKENTFEASIEHVREMDTVTAIARQYQGKKPMAVATGARGYIARRMLDQLGLRPMFQTIVSADEVDHHKPAPDTYLEAARRLGVDPAACVAFEDTDLGLDSARAAGMTLVDIRELSNR